MNITLKQSDIEKAVRLYIEREGFHLHNKTLAIDFSMGRGENGLSAILTIEDSVHIPGFTDAVDAVAAPGPSAAVQAMIVDQVVRPQPVAAGADYAPEVAKAAPAPKAAKVAELVAPAVVVDEVIEVAKVAPATLVEAAEALLIPSDSPAVAAVLHAAPVEAIAEAKVAEAAPAPVAEAQAKPTTSLFG